MTCITETLHLPVALHFASSTVTSRCYDVHVHEELYLMVSNQVWITQRSIIIRTETLGCGRLKKD
jgi:hypothetical protein